MSANTIAAYQARYGKPATVAERLRALAAKERTAGCRRLALASELDEIAELAEVSGGNLQQIAVLRTLENADPFQRIGIPCWKSYAGPPEQVEPFAENE